MSVGTIDVMRFIRRHARKGPGSWPDNVLAGWLSKRDADEELCVIHLSGQPTAMAAATTKPDGTIHVELMIAEQLWLWAALLRHLMRRWPDWRERKFTAVRRGRLRTFPVVRLIDRLKVRDPHGC